MKTHRHSGPRLLFGRRAVWLLMLLAVTGSASAVLAEPRAEEYSVKAACIYNFIKFVKWPNQAHDSAAEEDFVVGIVGADPFGNSFSPVENKPIAGGNKVLRVKRFGRFRPGHDYSGCNLIFIAASEREQTEAILAKVSRDPILTVGESDRFLETGGMINLVMIDQRVRWEINRGPARKAGLEFNAQLLRLATRVVEL